MTGAAFVPDLLPLEFQEFSAASAGKVKVLFHRGILVAGLPHARTGKQKESLAIVRMLKMSNWFEVSS